uniref:Uncharacterized protein n=1 Tax=Zea mays TaxID=4577 RepID=A0A804NZ99_MAIZE
MAGSGSRWGQDAVQDRTKRMWDEWPPFSRGRARPAWPYPDRVRHHMSRPRGAPYRLRAMFWLFASSAALSPEALTPALFGSTELG